MPIDASRDPHDAGKEYDPDEDLELAGRGAVAAQAGVGKALDGLDSDDDDVADAGKGAGSGGAFESDLEFDKDPTKSFGDDLLDDPGSTRFDDVDFDDDVNSDIGGLKQGLDLDEFDTDSPDDVDKHDIDFDDIG